MEKRGAVPPTTKHPQSTAFLLAQVGAHAASRFATRLQELELAPAHAGILRAIATSSGVSQQELAARLGMFPSRLVALIDELEARGLLERRDNADDRRVYALHVTEKGAKTMADIGRVARAHDDAICAALSEKERASLRSMLARIADEQGLAAGVHPGFARIADAQPPKPAQGQRPKPTRSRQ
ncbi:MAG: Transcriptional regulator, MarR family [Myxococcaceae bacterium]|nr:Transcriptional regulator, MarR family [Myxococcaceae bacterium]